LNYLQSLFSPKSITVIGASGKEGSLGKMFMDALTGMSYQGDIYPVNPITEFINGLTCFRNIQSLPIIPDLAVILLPKDLVPLAVNELAEKGVRTVIVISAGFREVGPEGLVREENLLSLIRQAGMRMLGPNCMGVFNTASDVSLNATFSPSPPRPGNVGFISQSGALGVAVLDLSKSRGLGFSCFVSTGNKADISEAECLHYLAADINTKSILLYQESLENPHELRKTCMQIVSEKPVLTLKAGRTQGGLKAASSHTGALASDDLLIDAFLKQCGIIRCDSLNELLDAALAFESNHVLSGKRIAIITNAGGPGILASDALEKLGFKIADLTEETTQALRILLPPEASVNNPVDMIASADHVTYREVCNLLERDPQVDVVLIIVVKPPVKTTCERIIYELKPLLEKTEKYFACSLMTTEDKNNGREILTALKVPAYSTPEAAAQALGALLRYKKIKEHFTDYTVNLNKEFRHIQLAGEIKRQAKPDAILPLLFNYQLQPCDYILTRDKSEVLQFQKRKESIVLKIANEEILHKSDFGLVKTGLRFKEEISAAFDEITTKAISLLPVGTSPIIMVQEMIESGLEFVLGAKRESHFGNVIMFGIGGVFIEVYRDVAFRILPIDLTDAYQMIGELKGKKILEGFRQYPMINHDLLAQMIFNFAQLIADHPEIIEMDLNPIIWSEKYKKPIIVDSRCTLITNIVH
jgi:acetyltransferase